MKSRFLLLITLFIAILAFSVSAQENKIQGDLKKDKVLIKEGKAQKEEKNVMPIAEADDFKPDPKAAPQILTSDLARKQIIVDPVKMVSFIFVDEDNIKKILINGEPQTFKPSTTVVISKKFRFAEGASLVSVVAFDEKGNKQEKSYLIGYGVSKTGDAPGSDSEFKEIVWKSQVSIAYEFDDNPTLDISSPVDIGDIKLQGVVKDSEQPDSRYTIGGSLVAGLGSLAGFVGAKMASYSKTDNDTLATRLIFLGVGYTTELSSEIKLLVSYMFANINVGGYDYSQNHFISPAIQFGSKDSEGFYTHLFGIDYVAKTFASSALDNGSQVGLKWEYNSLDTDKLDNFKSLIALGTSSDGTDKSMNSYVSFAFDWANKWTSGYKLDLGFGLERRNYPNEMPLSTQTGLGDTRVDIPIRLSTGVGYQFSKDWIAMYNYRYLFNLSNKSPYVRTIHGLTVSGAF